MGGKPLFRVSAETLINPIFCAMKRHLSNILSLTNAALWNCVGDSKLWPRPGLSTHLSFYLIIYYWLCSHVTRFIFRPLWRSLHISCRFILDLISLEKLPQKKNKRKWDGIKKKFLLRNPTGEHLTRSANAAAVLNVTPRDTAGRQQMERAHWGALVVICSYSWRWRGPGETNTSVVPWCYIKLLLSLTEPRTRWTGAAGVSRLQLGSAEPQKWALGISKSKAARGKQAGWTIHGHGESVLNI